MVDRITKRILKNHERWPRDWENICREGDENQLRLVFDDGRESWLMP